MMQDRAAASPLRLCAAAAAAALALYAFTLAPSLGFIDSGELAAAAHTFGIPHPTGYPLFVWLAGTWSRVPLASVIARLNLFSALATAAAVFACVDLMWRLLGRAHALGAPARGTAALSAGLLLAFNRTVWSNALTVEVYALHTLLLSLTLNATVRALEGGGRAWRWLAFLAGLSFSNHLTSVQLVPGLLIAAGVGWRAGALRVRALPVLAACLVAGLLPYLHLPLRAAQDPALNWGEPRTLAAFIDHVSARDYRGRFLMGLQPFLLSLREFASGLPRQSGGLGLALAAVGAVAASRRDRVMAALLGASLLTSVVVAASYAIPDIAPYFLLAYLVLALLGGYGVAQLAAWLRGRRVAAAAVAAAATSTLLLGNGSVSERGNFLVLDFTHNMFRSLAPRAIVISYQWDHLVSPALYLQAIEGVRPDVLIIDKRLCQKGWYVRQLARREPELVRGAKAELLALLEAAQAARGRGSDASLYARIDAFLQALVDANFETRPLYVTVDVEASFPSGYRQVPEGLALRLHRADRLPSPDARVWDDFRYRPFARRDGWTDRLRQYYAVMLMARGAFLEEAGRPRPAARYYERALGFEPSPAVRAQILARLLRVRRAAPP